MSLRERLEKMNEEVCLQRGKHHNAGCEMNETAIFQEGGYGNRSLKIKPTNAKNPNALGVALLNGKKLYKGLLRLIEELKTSKPELWAYWPGWGSKDSFKRRFEFWQTKRSSATLSIF